MPPENVMAVVIKHTGSNRDAFCQIHNATRGKRADVGEVEARSVGRTLVEFSTGSRFVITRKIVP